LSSQAELLKQHVEDLIGLVSGTRERADGERNVVPYDS
jgi:hypothetical protein